MPTFFFTTSAADLHCIGCMTLQEMMMRHEGGAGEVDNAGRNGRVVRNPHFAGAFFARRCMLFLQLVVNCDGHLKEFWNLDRL